MSKNRIDSMIFNYETTLRTDFRDGYITKQPALTKYEEKGTREKPCPTPLKDLYTLSDWKVPNNVPFTLFWKEYKVNKVNPWTLQAPHFDLIDNEREQVQKTRPRVVITPAARLDDVEEPTRQFLLSDLYKSNYMHATREQAELLAKSHNIVAPLPERMSPANPLSIPKLKPPYVSPEWRMKSVSYDKMAYRSSGDSTRDFWLRRTPQCMKCDETAVVEQRS